MTSLYGTAAYGIALEKALAVIPGGCALLTTPSAYHVAKVNGTRCVRPTGPVDLSAVYEARVFTQDIELRWTEPGHAVVLAEREDALPRSFGERIDTLTAETTRDVPYLVWGKATPLTPGWIILHSNRIGSLTIPMADPPPRGSRIRLLAREYIVADEIHGNAYVAEERLIDFESYSPKGDER
ncbi:type III-D CRISPR-associated protein Csx19 [Thermostaphylospora chromogena]|uniref:CRISPR-associated protein, TIGR03984 family n=1 Tax=Thermostaphylospora chromogena TaxID=35622 RepID=A0A1H1HDG0_9ACTN|nr:CRISPR-associated protein Csx19 [Thermostaphylospora chromogena]SDR23484.1 CRISPR-associated protein, TIGR03984 family [Thermostaphylospora chromogena]